MVINNKNESPDNHYENEKTEPLKGKNVEKEVLSTLGSSYTYEKILNLCKKCNETDDDADYNKLEEFCKELNKIKNLDHNTIAIILISQGKTWRVIEYIDKFINLDQEKILSLIVSGCNYWKELEVIKKNNSELNGLDLTFDGFLFDKDDYREIFGNTERFDKNIDRKKIVKTVIKGGNCFFPCEKLWHLEERGLISQKKMADYLLDFKCFDALVLYYYNFRDIDFQEYIFKGITLGKISEIISSFEKNVRRGFFQRFGMPKIDIDKLMEWLCKADPLSSPRIIDLRKNLKEIQKQEIQKSKEQG